MVRVVPKLLVTKSGWPRDQVGLLEISELRAGEGGKEKAQDGNRRGEEKESRKN